MFSSLNVIDEAEYSFYTTFQDHQYKVTASSQACPLNLNLKSRRLQMVKRAQGRGKSSSSVCFSLLSVRDGRKQK